MGLFKESILYLLSIFGVLLAFKSKDKNKMLIATTFFIIFLFFSSIRQKEMRFFIILLPYMYLLIAYNISYLINKYKAGTPRKVILAFVIVALVFSLLSIIDSYKYESSQVNIYKTLQEKFNSDDVSGRVWISNPVIPLLSNKKIDNLMYYMVFDEEKKKELMEETKRADFIFIDSCDLGCRPGDTFCENNKNELLAHFKQQFKIIYSSEINQCSQFIFQK